MKLACFPVTPAILFAIAGIAGVSVGLKKPPLNIVQLPTDGGELRNDNNHPEGFERPGLGAELRQTPSGTVVDVSFENREAKTLALKNEVLLVDDQETPLNLATENPALHLTPSNAHADDTVAIPAPPPADGYFIVLVRTAVLDADHPTRGVVKEQRLFVYVENGEVTPVSQEEFSNNSRMNLARTLNQGEEQ